MGKFLKIHLIFRILKNESSYLLSSLVMFTSLFFILFILFMSKEIFIYYSNADSVLLPNSLLVVEKDIETVKKVLKSHNISKKDYLLAEVKNYEKLGVFTNINGKKSLPKDFTLLSFDIQEKKKITVQCNDTIEKTIILDIKLKHHKNWTFKLPKLLKCKMKEDIYLITAHKKIRMFLKKNNKYAKLIYKSNDKTDKLFYHFLIDLEESLFIKYFAYSKFFIPYNSKLSIETQEHAKMLSSLFKVIFSKGKQRILLNHEAYSALTSYKKIPFNIRLLDKDYVKAFTVLDELKFNIKNDKELFYNNIILANSSSLGNIEYDKTIIFCKNNTINKSMFINSKQIKRSEFQIVKKSKIRQVNLSIYSVVAILFILTVLLIKSFISRNYRLYKETFNTLIFYGYSFKIITLVLSSILVIAMGLSYFLSIIVLKDINMIFNLYYIDLIRLNFEYTYIFVYLGLSIFISYFLEIKTQYNIINLEGK